MRSSGLAPVTRNLTWSGPAWARTTSSSTGLKWAVRVTGAPRSASTVLATRSSGRASPQEWTATAVAGGIPFCVQTAVIVSRPITVPVYSAVNVFSTRVGVSVRGLSPVTVIASAPSGPPPTTETVIPTAAPRGDDSELWAIRTTGIHA